MAFEITREDITPMYIHEGKPLYLTADRSEAVEEGDERAAFLLVGSGGQLTDEDAEKYGLKGKKVAPENKLKAGVAENKEQTPQGRSEGPHGAGGEAVVSTVPKKGK